VAYSSCVENTIVTSSRVEGQPWVPILRYVQRKPAWEFGSQFRFREAGSKNSNGLRRSRFFLIVTTGKFFCSHFSHPLVVFRKGFLKFFQSRCDFGVPGVRNSGTKITDTIFESTPRGCGSVIHGINSCGEEHRRMTSSYSRCVACRRDGRRARKTLQFFSKGEQTVSYSCEQERNTGKSRDAKKELALNQVQ
jgi:hypothetical protein